MIVEAAVAVTQVYGKLPAQDVERARAFYAEKLGLVPFAEHNGHLRYRVDGATFIVFPSSGRPSGTHDQLGLVVEDLDAALERLKSRGVSFEAYPPPPGTTVTEGVMDAGHMRAAWFKDSEGNLISIAEFRSAPPGET